VKRPAEASRRAQEHPTVFEPLVFVASIGFALVGIVIGLELLTRVGITPNTSIVGAIVAMGLARVPIARLSPFRSVARQNLLQTVISSATFGGANAVFLPLGAAWLVGGRDLVPPMLVGATLGMLIGALTLYWLFDSSIYPASGSWPAGVATAECLMAGDRGGKRARLLAAAGVAGGIGQALGVPMDVVGICWIGNAIALTMFGAGLLVRGYARPLWGIEIDRLYIPHGIMIGAGLVALWQIAKAIGRGATHGRHSGNQRTALARALALNVAAACLMATIAGLHAMMSYAALAIFVVFAAVAALVSALVVGIAAMHAGWFPAFATALIFLIVGTVAGLPAAPLALLVGFTASGGPAFADLGFDLKTGWIVRGCGADAAAEHEGRWQQLIAAVLGFLIAVVFVSMVFDRYFMRNLLPPADRVYAATIAAGASRDVLRRLLLWAVPGALLQAAGGHSRQIGVLFATGLLIYNPAAGWAALAALVIRRIAERRYGTEVQGPMYVVAGGFLAGSAIVSFSAATLKSR
jgi:uncharacterized oligopeptide transporter (OPT) family protein